MPPRKENLPELVKQQMLDLHYLALVQAKDFLLPGGAVLSCLGARVPLRVFLSLAELAGYVPSFLSYSWKVQGDPELIHDYALNQKNGFGPFFFYRAKVLQEAFKQVGLAESGENALEIERSLLPQRLDPASAFQKWASHWPYRGGSEVGVEMTCLPPCLRY